MSDYRLERLMSLLDSSLASARPGDRSILAPGMSLQDVVDSLMTRLDGVQRQAFAEKMQQLDTRRPCGTGNLRFHLMSDAGARSPHRLC